METTFQLWSFEAFQLSSFATPWTNDGLMLDHSRWRWANIKPLQDQHVVFAGCFYLLGVYSPSGPEGPVDPSGPGAPVSPSGPAEPEGPPGPLDPLGPKTM